MELTYSPKDVTEMHRNITASGPKQREEIATLKSTAGMAYIQGSTR
jgi:hypothetical protein